MESFLDKVAKELLKKYEGKLSEITVVLPTRRARVFLSNALQKQIQSPIFSPKILSVQEFIELLADMRSIDTIEQLFLFYKIYKRSTLEGEILPFEQYYTWAKMLLKDFSDIDAYLVDATQILNNLKEIKEIESWELTDRPIDKVQKFLHFWNLLPDYHRTFTDFLRKEKIGYQGLLTRVASENVGDFIKNNPNEFYVFVGFNALMPSEQKVITTLLEEDRAAIYWDIDKVFIDNKNNLTAHFIRKIKDDWRYFKLHPFEWVVDEFSKAKDIHVIGTSKAIGQAKIVGKIIEQQIQEDKEAIDKTALILSEKGMLLPILGSLPSSVEHLNITLEYSARNNPVQFLINKIFRMHINAKARSKKQHYVFYYKDVIDIIQDPFVCTYLDAGELYNDLVTNNITFVVSDKLQKITTSDDDFFNLIFEPWSDSQVEVLDRLLAILMYIKRLLSEDVERNKVTLAFVYEIHKVVQRIKNYIIVEDSLNLRALYILYKQVIETAEVSFDGEPLMGLQIMGILESRVLDFDTVIFTSANEGKLPFGKTQNSFIPYDLRRHFQLPTYFENDAIYTYHFYRLLQRAKKIYLIYNTESDGLDGGEKSRFITQLKIDNLPNHRLVETLFNAKLPPKATSKIQIEKSTEVMQRLEEMAKEGFSPSSISLYLRNPVDFYFQRVLNIKEVKEVEETIEANTLGNVIHDTLEKLYKPLIGKYLSIDNVEQMEKKLNRVLLGSFKEKYADGNIQSGKNRLAFEVTKATLYRFLKIEKQKLAKDTVKILHLEKCFSTTIELEGLHFPIKIKGTIDRIEERNGVIRILDYKTGAKVSKSSLQLQTMENFLQKKEKDKIIQLLTYAYMYNNSEVSKPIEVGIISFKNLSADEDLLFGIKLDRKNADSIISDKLLSEYQEVLRTILSDIFNPEEPFVEQ
ncbi:MAG: PD-(D/E)XK nuclease family protein [Bacteroidota bacterium]|nr:PD-(D/E)XK nuclease family protein [Bacteroidota bacterium]